MDEDGYLDLVDRLKDTIITGRENVYPREVDEVLYTRSEVLECAVLGLPDYEYGEQVTAFIVPYGFVTEAGIVHSQSGTFDRAQGDTNRHYLGQQRGHRLHELGVRCPLRSGTQEAIEALPGRGVGW